MEKNASNFNAIHEVTRLVEQNEAMKSFFKDRIAELDADGKRILQIIAKHQPISEFNLRSHTRKIGKTERGLILVVLMHNNIIRNIGGKLTVHPAFMEVL